MSREQFSMTQHFDQKIKDIVLGFTREVQALLPYQQRSYYNIPLLVSHIIIWYYSPIEYFTAHGGSIIISKSKEIAILQYKNPLASNTFYGAFKINKNGNYNKLIWNLLINIPNDQTIAVIGIDSSNQTAVNCTFAHPMHSGKYYGWQSSVRYLGQAGIFMSHDKTLNHTYGVTWSKSHVNVVMGLNVKNTTLKFYVDGEDQGIATDNVQFEDGDEYLLAISMDEALSKVQILDFHII